MGGLSEDTTRRHVAAQSQETPMVSGVAVTYLCEGSIPSPGAHCWFGQGPSSSRKRCGRARYPQPAPPGPPRILPTTREAGTRGPGLTSRSSSGPGRQLLKPATGVQISHGTPRAAFSRWGGWAFTPAGRVRPPCGVRRESKSGDCAELKPRTTPFDSGSRHQRVVFNSSTPSSGLGSAGAIPAPLTMVGMV